MPLLDEIGSKVSVVAEGRIGSRTLILGLENGQALIVKHKYVAKYDQDANRTLLPEIVFPYGEEPIALLNEPVASIAMNENDENMVLVASGNDSLAQIVHFTKEEDLFGDGFELERYDAPAFELSLTAVYLIIVA